MVLFQSTIIIQKVFVPLSRDSNDAVLYAAVTVMHTPYSMHGMEMTAASFIWNS